jgi:hypothetical protein
MSSSISISRAFAGLESNDQLDLYCLLDRQVGGLSACTWIQAIEALFLLVIERTVKFRERRLQRFHRSQHRIESLLHYFEASDRRKRAIGRAVGFEQLDGL